MSERGGRFHPLLVGAAAGLSLGDLLLGLNPDVLGLLSGARVLLGAAALGALFLSPFSLVGRARRRTRPSWALLALSLVLLAVFAEYQRSVHYLFVHNGGRRVLVTTTLAASAAALAAMAAAVRRPTPSGSTCILLAVMTLLASPPLLGRRGVERGGLGTPGAVPRTATRSLLVLGFDGLSWDLLVAGASEGSLPVFARLLKEGAAGPLESLEPYDRDALWTSAATGKRPAKTGVVSSGVWATPLGSFHLLPRLPGAGPTRVAGGMWRPADAPARRSRTFWEILASRGHEASLLNWPASYPAGGGLVLWASDRLFEGDPRPDAARPAEAAARARLFRALPSNLDQQLARALAPQGLSEPELARAAPLAAAARDLTVVSAALGAVPTGPLNVSTLVLSGLASVARPFGPSAEPARYWGLAPPGVEARARALDRYYRFLDETLGDLLAREGKDRTICVFAPVGYGPPPPLTAVRRFLAGQEPEASPDASPDGFVILSGSGIRAGVRLTSAGVMDIAPTLLVLAGEPIARDMDGRVLAEAFDERFAESASIPIVTTFEPGGPQ